MPSFLAELGLAAFVAAFDDQGYDSLATLRALNSSEFHQLVKDTDMKGGHAVRLRHALWPAVASGAAAVLTPAPAALSGR